MNTQIAEIFAQIRVDDEEDTIWNNMLQLRAILERNYRGHFGDHPLILTEIQMEIKISLEEVDEIVEAIFARINSSDNEWYIGNWIRVLQKARPRALLPKLQIFFLANYSKMSEGVAYHTILCLRNCYVYRNDKDFDYIKSLLRFDELMHAFQALSNSSYQEVATESKVSISNLEWFITQQDNSL